MKNKCKVYLFTTLALCIILLGGCKNKSITDNSFDKSKDISPIVSENITLEPTETNKLMNDTGTEAPLLSLEPIETELIYIYSMNEDTLQKEAVTAVISAHSEITPQEIVDLVVSAMADASFIIKIDSVTTDEDKVIVSFENDQPPVINLSIEVESEILDAMAQSILDNLPEYKKIIFRVIGDDYISDNYTFDRDFIYMEQSQ